MTTVAVLTLNVVVSQVVRSWLCATLCVALALLCGTFGPARRADAASGVFAGATAIAAGPFHACALRIDGTVWCWGENGNGQLGLGNTADKNVPVRVPGIEDAIAIAAGGSDSGPSNGHTCALLRDSSVWCWGDNTTGQLGNASTTDSPSPVAVVGGHTFKQISAGRLHTCGLKFSGQVYCWGQNHVGQLGTGDLVTPHSTPVAMTGDLAGNVVEISAGGQHTCGRTVTSALYCVGGDGAGQLGNGSPGTSVSTPVAVTLAPLPTDVALGGFHSCARLVTGVLRCWGSDISGELGNGATTGSQFSPVVVQVISDSVALGKTSFGQHQCAVHVTTRVSCWGSDAQGQLGNGVGGSSDVPVNVQNDDGALNTIIEVSGGIAFTCALSNLGEVWCWGDNAFGQLGNGTNEDSPLAVPVTTLDMIGRTQIVNGALHTCFLPPMTRAHCVGFNGNGRLGDGTTQQRLSPVLAGNGAPVSLDAGSAHTCTLNIGGTVSCWGAGGQGQLGNSGTGDSSTPVNVTSLSGAVQVSTGGAHSCAVRYEGTVRCWGQNIAGQLGNADNDNSSVPVVVQGVSTAVAVSAGNQHTCALLIDGEIACWGAGGEGRLGHFSTEDSNVPVTAGDVGNATDVAAGMFHTCAVRVLGDVRCWGRGDEGQIGNGAFTDTDNGTSVQGTGPTGLRAKQVVSGNSHSCALFQTGLVACWGANGEGQLGDGTTMNRGTPMFAQVLEASVISAGALTSCAKIEDDRVRCWGSNFYGQYGDGTTITTDGVPVDTGLDSDLDGCADVEELGSDPAFGGDREFVAQWDFYDVFLFGEEPNGSIDLSDTLDLLSLFGALPGELAYLPWLDRVAPDPVDPYRTALATDPGDLGIDLSDALLNLGSFGHSCVELP